MLSIGLSDKARQTESKKLQRALIFLPLLQHQTRLASLKQTQRCLTVNSHCAHLHAMICDPPPPLSALAHRQCLSFIWHPINADA
jgi:hypothetical protein